MDNIKITRGGKNNMVAVSWFEDPNWPEAHKEAERRYQAVLLRDVVEPISVC